MPSLSLQKWVRFEPSIPGNRELPEAERFFVEIRVGPAKVELDAFLEQLGDGAKATTDVARIEAMRGWVRLGSVPLTIDGALVADVDALLALFLAQASVPLWHELGGKVLYLNSVGGAREVFCGPPSGGSSSTPIPTDGKAAGATAAR